MNRTVMGSRFIINADDFGMSPGVNKGIQQLFQQGRLTSASLMVNSPWSAEAIEYARSEPEMRLGVHLNLTTGRPILPAEEIPSLVTPKGEFHDLLAFLGRSYTGRLRQAEMEAELSAQIEVGLDQGIRPWHLDSHMHLHSLAALRDLVNELAHRYEIPVVRNPDLSAFVVPPLGKPALARALRRTGAHLLRASQARTARREAGTKNGLNSTEHLFYLRWCIERGPDPVAAFEACLEPVEGRTVEIIAHPAEVDDYLPQLSNYVEGRQLELDFLGGDQFRRLLETSE